MLYRDARGGDGIAKSAELVGYLVGDLADGNGNKNGKRRPHGGRGRGAARGVCARVPIAEQDDDALTLEERWARQSHSLVEKQYRNRRRRCTRPTARAGA